MAQSSVYINCRYEHWSVGTYPGASFLRLGVQTIDLLGRPIRMVGQRHGVSVIVFRLFRLMMSVSRCFLVHLRLEEPSQRDASL